MGNQTRINADLHGFLSKEIKEENGKLAEGKLKVATESTRLAAATSRGRTEDTEK